MAGSNNALFRILIYKQGKTWMFDEERLGIKAEPFVLGASELIQKYLDRKGMKRRRKNIPITFSKGYIPGADIVLTCVLKCYPISSKFKELDTLADEGDINALVTLHDISLQEDISDYSKEAESAWYVDQEYQECWLCPAQLKFFGKVAETIYAKID
jgi:hypothetical protein